MGNKKAQDFQAGTPGAYGDIASRKNAVPALRYKNSNENGVNYVRFDGIEKSADGTAILLLDAKLRLPPPNKGARDDFLKSLNRVKDAVAQNKDGGFKVVYEFPNEGTAAEAVEFIFNSGFNKFISVRVRQP